MGYRSPLSRRSSETVLASRVAPASGPLCSATSPVLAPFAPSGPSSDARVHKVLSALAPVQRFSRPNRVQVIDMPRRRTTGFSGAIAGLLAAPHRHHKRLPTVLPRSLFARRFATLPGLSPVHALEGRPNSSRSPAPKTGMTSSRRTPVRTQTGRSLRPCARTGRLPV